ncbi:MAG: protein-disulfide reductase DsbD [Gammaproteobacteria bacterium]|nr:protein-disulfide reductase DsbD [Gammaproteobacteria bacterium]
MPARYRIIACLLCLLSLLGLPAVSQAEGLFGRSLFGNPNAQDNPFLPVDEAFAFSYRMDGSALLVEWRVAPGYYLYADRMTWQAPEGVHIEAPSYSNPGEPKDDPYFGRVKVFTTDTQAHFQLTLPPGQREAEVQISYQGCAEAGLCYPPQTRSALFMPGSATPAATSAGAPPTTEAGTPTSNTADTESAQSLFETLGARSPLFVAGLFFLLGIGLTFTPCVLPMIPIITSVVSGQSDTSTRQNVALALTYVLGMALTYAAAGVLVGLLGAGANLQAHLQAPWLLGLFAALFALLALAMFGVYELRLPRALEHHLHHHSSRLEGGRYLSVFVIGALSALIVSPCVSAPLAGALLYISTTQDAWLGGMALLALGLGMGVPLMLVAVLGKRILPRSGPWMHAVKGVFGVLLLGVALWLLERVLPMALILGLWALLLAACAVHLGAFEHAKPGWPRTARALGLMLFVFAILQLIGAASGGNRLWAPLSHLSNLNAAPAREAPTSLFARTDDPSQLENWLTNARTSGQPVMIDLYADWCVSCKIMEENVFADTAVHRALTGVRSLQLDMTRNTAEQQAFLKRWGLFGPPAVLFLDAQGQALPAMRILGDIDRDGFLKHLERHRAALHG